MMTRRWKPCPGFEDSYSVSDDGLVRRDAPGKGTRVGRILRPQPAHKHGYVAVLLSAPGRKRTILYVHRLVALAFHGRTCIKMQVNHIDGVRYHNHASNLEWTTQSQNTLHAISNGLFTHARGDRNGRARLTADAVRAIRHSTATHASLARQFGVSEMTIAAVRKRKVWGHVP